MEALVSWVTTFRLLPSPYVQVGTLHAAAYAIRKVLVPDTPQAAYTILKKTIGQVKITVPLFLFSGFFKSYPIFDTYLRRSIASLGLGPHEGDP